MKYLVRSVKYFFYLAVMLTLVVLAMVAFGFVDSDIDSIFRNGYDSLWQIAAMLAVFAAIYPRFGFSKRRVHLGGEYSETRDEVIKAMQARSYVLTGEEGQTLYFRPGSVASRALKMFEDRITLSYSFGGYDIEGLTRDVVRLQPALERIQDQNAL